MKEKLIEIIGQYQITDYSWLDVPWIMAAILIIFCTGMLIFGLLTFLNRFSR